MEAVTLLGPGKAVTPKQTRCSRQLGNNHPQRVGCTPGCNDYHRQARFYYPQRPCILEEEEGVMPTPRCRSVESCRTCELSAMSLVPLLPTASASRAIISSMCCQPEQPNPRWATTRLSFTCELCHLSLLRNWETGRDKSGGTL